MSLKPFVLFGVRSVEIGRWDEVCNHWFDYLFVSIPIFCIPCVAYNISSVCSIFPPIPVRFYSISQKLTFPQNPIIRNSRASNFDANMNLLPVLFSVYVSYECVSMESENAPQARVLIYILHIKTYYNRISGSEWIGMDRKRNEIKSNGTVNIITTRKCLTCIGHMSHKIDWVV